MKRKRSIAIVITLSIFFVCLLIGCCWTLLFPVYGINGPSAQQGQENATGLIMALEQYKTEVGSYPSSLESLVPTYLSDIPQPAQGWQYQYQSLESGKEFMLSFTIGKSLDGDYCEYTSITKHWQCSDLI